MPFPRTKICGLTTHDTVGAAVRHGADYLGFVHFPNSPRHVSLEQAHGLSQPVGERAVLLLVDPDMALVDAVVRRIAPAIVQFHGNETPQFLSAVRQRHRIKMWKAIPVRTTADIRAADDYRDIADLVLFDAKPPPASHLPGGNGVRFDWELLRGASIGQQWGLSGGLDAGNIGEALAITAAPLIDVSSGVEDSPGQKNVDKIIAFLKAVRAS